MIRLLLPYHCSPSKEVRAGTHTGQEPGGIAFSFLPSYFLSFSPPPLGHVSQAGLEPLILLSPSVGITDVHHSTWL